MIAAILSALAPVLIVTALGVFLQRQNFLSEDGWRAVEKLCYFILFPAIIFREIAAADFTGLPVLSMALALMLAILSMAGILLLLRQPLCNLLELDGPAFTSLFQGATRWHALIALAVIPLSFGPAALPLGAVAVAAMIPLLNLLNVGVLGVYGARRSAGLQDMALTLATNPYVLSSLGGVVWKMASLPLPPVALVTLDLLGKGALGLALLTVGAGLRLKDLGDSQSTVVLATVLKLLIMPLFAVFWLKFLGVSDPAFGPAVLCAGVPAASGAYVLAQRMGGDGPLIARILTFQILCAALSLPVLLGLLI